MHPVEPPLTSDGGSKSTETSLETTYAGSDFAVVMRVRHRFGDGFLGDAEVDVDSAAPFVGQAGEFSFACPNVDSTQEALLQFEHRGSEQSLTFPDYQPDGGLQGITQEHPVSINGAALAGGIPATPRRGQMPMWSSRTLIIQPGVLREDNVLRIASTADSLGRFDDFTVDNVVVFYKTRPRPILQPPFSPNTQVVYARKSGSDSSGSGTLANPYRTFQRAVRDVPDVLSPGTRWIVDITGIGQEFLPVGYVLPAWKSAEVFNPVTDRFWVGYAGVNIQATPQRVAGFPEVETKVTPSEIASLTPDPVTGLITIRLKAPHFRPSWAGNALKGKLVIWHSGGADNCVIWESDRNHIRITSTTVPSEELFEIMEPSAHLTGASSGAFRGVINAINCDSIAFNGIRISKSDPADKGAGLFAQGYGEVITQLCELESPGIATLGTFLNRIQRSWIKGAPVLWGRFVVNQGLFAGCTSTPIRGPGVPQFRSTVFDACAPLEVADQLFQTGGPLATTVSYFRMDNCLIRNVPGATGDGLRWHGVKGQLNHLDIYGCGRDGIHCDAGTGILELNVVCTTGTLNKGYGLSVADGMCVKVDRAWITNTTDPPGTRIGGAKKDIAVGTTEREWLRFLDGGDGHQVLNEWDISSASATGATGSGARVYA